MDLQRQEVCIGKLVQLVHTIIQITITQILGIQLPTEVAHIIQT